jgi:hydroxymethylbilane synthase
MTRTLRIATRRSALAMWQAQHVKALLQQQHADLQIELVPIVTRGDQVLDRPLAEIGGKGLFLKELEQALLAGEADLAVHSMKDMPAELTPGLELEAALPRATPFDAWLSRGGESLAELPAGSRVGTSSLRRQCQLLAVRPELEVVSLRGNVDTRLQKLLDGDYDAIILACAGLERLGLAEHITEVLAAPLWLPAPTQGIIGLQCRTTDDETRLLLEPLADEDSAVQAMAERAVTRVLQGSCQLPLGVYAQIRGPHVEVTAMVGTADGRRILRASDHGPIHLADSVGQGVADELLEAGAQTIIDALS